MATLPSALALTNIADGALAVAADERNNFAAIQTEANALLTILGSGSTGQFFTGNGTTVSMTYPPGYEIGYTQITSSANITDTAEVTATALISPGALVFDGGPVIVEFFAPGVTTSSLAAGSLVIVTLFEGATQIGRLGEVVDNVAGQVTTSPVCLRYRFTPSAASHTYKLCAFTNSTTGTPQIVAGTPGTNTYVPAYIRFVKV